MFWCDGSGGGVVMGLGRCFDGSCGGCFDVALDVCFDGFGWVL